MNMSIYKGLFVRSYPGDTNVFPKHPDSNIWLSTDIVLRGPGVGSDHDKVDGEQ